MYLSRIDLDMGHYSVRNALRNCEDMHRNIMQAFPGEQFTGSARSGIGAQYRLVETRSALYLLLLSRVKPNEEALRKNGMYLSTGSPKDVSALKAVFKTGMVLRFELLAYPSKKVSGDGKNSRRVFLKTAEERADWLARQGQKYGFDVLTADEGGRIISVDGIKGDMHIHYDGVTFTGMLRITDSVRFFDACCSGIGAGKSYGLGMLTVAK